MKIYIFGNTLCLVRVSVPMAIGIVEAGVPALTRLRQAQADSLIV
jgi:hypothetical protein